MTLPRRPAALIFDIDGTMIDSDPVHAEIFRAFFAERGREIDHDFYKSEVHGRETDAVFAEHFPDEDAQAIADDKEARFRDRLRDGAGEAVPGLHDILDRAQDAGQRLIAVTNAPRSNGEAMMAAIGVADRFETLIVGGECAAGKPDPAPYRAALDALGLGPDEAVVFEDSAAGVQSAAGAGLAVVGLRTTLDDEGLRAAGAALTVADFTDPALAPLTEGPRTEGTP